MLLRIYCKLYAQYNSFVLHFANHCVQTEIIGNHVTTNISIYFSNFHFRYRPPQLFMIMIHTELQFQGFRTKVYRLFNFVFQKCCSLVSNALPINPERLIYSYQPTKLDQYIICKPEFSLREKGANQQINESYAKTT